jgi:hypothetical protein
MQMKLEGGLLFRGPLCIIVIKHPDDCHWSDRKMFLENTSMWLNILINMYMLAYRVSIKLRDRCLLPRRWVASRMNLCKKWNVSFRPFEITFDLCLVKLTFMLWQPKASVVLVGLYIKLTLAVCLWRRFRRERDSRNNAYSCELYVLL